LVFAFFTGILSGIYPSIVLSSFEPIKVVRGEFQTSGTGVLMRRILVIFQFAITTSLIVAIGIIYTQIDFLKSRNMGYNRKNVMVIVNPVRSSEDTFKQKLSGFTGVISSGRINTLPSDNFGHIDVKPEGTNREDGYQPVQMSIDYDLFDILGIPIIQGRNFSKEFPADTLNNVIVNEELVRIAGWSNPIGKRIVFYYTRNNISEHNVIGVVKDFHYGSPKQTIEPTIFHLNQRAPNLMVRLHPDRINETVKRIEELFVKLYPGQIFNYTFLDDIFERQFNTDQDFAGNISVFAGIAIFISCFGLIGLVSYTVEQRRKEMAVRKILGCNGTKLVSLLTSDFLKWITIANVIAWPCVFFVMQIWINGFVYKASFTIMPYLFGGIGSLAIALVTTLFQTIRAARANPLDTLRNC
jgi:putative ABC transport system permease protein